jgi:hypothetical protein
MSPEEEKSLRSMVDLHTQQLGEHFSSVRIFVTRNSEDGEADTAAIDSGSGNFYAQLGQIQEWMDIQRQYQKNWAIRNDKGGEQ